MREEGAVGPESQRPSIAVLRLYWASAGLRASLDLIVGLVQDEVVVFGRESIFSETHTNEFCGIDLLAQEPVGPCATLHTGRWVYEKRAGNASCGGDVRSSTGHLSTAAFAGRS